MPWWIWLLLALFMLGMFIAGLVFAGMHGYRAIKGIMHVGRQATERFSDMGESPSQTEVKNEAPWFTRPLQDAADCYIDAHAQVIERQEAKRNRHRRQWANWKHFND
ncbi:hypothetical protein [Bifidobacterium sp. UBA6881]|uniref:hypothetical protein n=1 Tax=Bifidobacterium sp. UBA6881 TaxID=1946109 RepID=UPI000EDC8C1A|nr:hypothetical protein [Bifidobacterium sp. UBA6881]HCH21483.1 hypothetical protein [Bifidobacterium sp.]